MGYIVHKAVCSTLRYNPTTKREFALHWKFWNNIHKSFFNESHNNNPLIIENQTTSYIYYITLFGHGGEFSREEQNCFERKQRFNHFPLAYSISQTPHAKHPSSAGTEVTYIPYYAPSHHCKSFCSKDQPSQRFWYSIPSPHPKSHNI